MNKETPETEWTAAEENILILARELEWVEAYAEDNPRCHMGRLYWDFLHRELILAHSEQ